MSFDTNRSDRLRRVYRGPRHEVTRRDEDGTEWVKLSETDLTTGEVTWYADYQPFRQTPLDSWEPRRW